MQHKKNSAANKNVETAVRTTAMMIVLSCSSFFFADPEVEFLEPFFLGGGRGGGDLDGGKDEFRGGGGRLRAGGRLGGGREGEGEGERDVTGLEARTLLGVSSIDDKSSRDLRL